MIDAQLLAAAEARRRPSALTKIAACPGSPVMEAAVIAKFGEPREDDAASVGTIGHTWVARGIHAWKVAIFPENDRLASWGEVIADTCNKATTAGVDGWTVACIQMCLEFARDMIAKHEVEPDDVLVEHHLDMSTFGLPRGGTADLILVLPFKKVIVVDWKLGFLDQGDADDHDQLMGYGIAAATTFKAQQIEVALYQPRAEKLRRASRATFDSASIKANLAWLEAVLRRSRAADPVLEPSYACLNCAANTRCPALKEWIVNTIEALAKIDSPTDADTWGQAAAFYKVAKKVGEDGIDQVKLHLNNDGKATGWGLASSGSMTEIDAQMALKIAREKGFLGEILKFVKLPAEAAKVFEIDAAVTTKEKAKSLKPVKGAA
jgi:hypothetical protein